MNETLSLDFEVKSSIERVWDALTNSAMLSRWMFFEANNFQAVVGHKFQFRPKPETGWPATVDCEVLEVDAPHRLSYTWEVREISHRTQITWTLTETQEGVTRIHLEQTGFARDAKQEMEGAKYGWTRQVGQLQALLASP
ncbi:MAG: SRPBCC domain-containing protein [Actinomycetia bacterium]|nr:SRPBCC domain-containing protein [Actinomycetes bacterium]